MPGYTVIAPMGEDIETLFPVIRNFLTDKIILISTKEDKGRTHEFDEILERFKIHWEVVEVKNYSIDEIFRIMKSIVNSERDREILINASSGSKITACNMLCAAYIHGIKAVGVMNGNVILLPIMKFSYYKIISDKKLGLLRLLYKKGECCESLEELSKESGMSVPLISYHINGSRKVEGLKQMGLVETTEEGKKMEIKLSSLGKMLMAGYI